MTASPTRRILSLAETEYACNPAKFMLPAEGSL
jgi:hypothetical protein